jgi:hypothetical protein
MKIRFIDYYKRFSAEKITAGNTNYGNFLSYPLQMLINILESKYNIETVYNDDFDILVITDIDQELYNYAKKLPSHIKKILVLTESVIYTPFGHSLDIQSDSIWSSVVSYNREIYTKHTIYYDIPVTGIQMPIKLQDKKQQKGCHISTFKRNDIRGYTYQRDKLITYLANNNFIDIYGSRWLLKRNFFGKTSDKINTISGYYYYIAIENAKYFGYVTEKIGDAILAEVPCLYFGDEINAQRRFPDTFVSLPDLSFDSFINAKKVLFDKYDFYLNNVRKQKRESINWCNSYFEAMSDAIIN